MSRTLAVWVVESFGWGLGHDEEGSSVWVGFNRAREENGGMGLWRLRW